MSLFSHRKSTFHNSEGKILEKKFMSFRSFKEAAGISIIKFDTFSLRPYTLKYA